MKTGLPEVPRPVYWINCIENQGESPCTQRLAGYKKVLSLYCGLDMAWYWKDAISVWAEGWPLPEPIRGETG